ncbi:MAG: GNAT family protein [Paracoccaceae bacterium]
MDTQRKVGEPVEGWKPAPRPEGIPLEGRYARLEKLDPPAHAPDLHRANTGFDWLWDYLPYGPFVTEAEYRQWADLQAGLVDPLFYTIIDKATGRAGGVASYLRIFPEIGTIEVGHINLAPEIQRGRVATEAMFLMMDWAFSNGYRRYEWKCDALNMPSRRAAQRLGFSYEGVFRQATIVKGRNRDTAWFAITDKDWPRLKAGFLAWLNPDNFDAQGVQRQSLSDLTAPARAASDPAL